MNKRSKRFLAILMCVAMLSSVGCATTAPKEEPSQPPLTIRELRPNGEIVVRNVNMDVEVSHVDRTRQNWKCRVARALHASIAIYANPSLAVVLLPGLLKQ